MMSFKSLRQALMLGVATLSAMATVATVEQPACAQEVTRTYDIPAQDLNGALRAFAMQTGRDVLYPPEIVAGKRSPGVRGPMSERRALEALLVGSGLSFEQTASNGYAVRSETSRPDLGASNETSTSDEIVVVGTNIRGAQNSTVPTVVLDRDYIDSTGVSTTTRLMETLPQNFASANQSAVLLTGNSDPRPQGSAINLRGIGEGTTLVLLNGRRMPLGFFGTSVDISSLPLTAFDRVEVLTDGASALYGSDAVGGVVNFVLRDNPDSAESRLSIGDAHGSTEIRVGQSLGANWSTGSVLASGEYYHRDLLTAGDRDFISPQSQIGSLLPRDENWSTLIAARQDVGPNVTTFADALYSHRRSYNEAGVVSRAESYSTDNSQSNLTAGLTWETAADWSVEFSLGYGENEQDQIQRSSGSDFLVTTDFAVVSGRLTASGKLPHFFVDDARAAIGIDYREEELTFGNSNGASGERAQRVASLYGEVLIPLLGGIPNLSHPPIELSLAARYDDYSSFGSSVDPRLGIAWRPNSSLLLRAGIGTSFVAPRLSDYDTASNFAIALTQPDPGTASDESVQLWIGGASTEYRPQESENFTLGIEFEPASLQGFKSALNYYNIRYTNRIASPGFFGDIIANPSAFAALIERDPTAARVSQVIAATQGVGQGFFAFNPDFSQNNAFDPASVDVIIEGRRRNLAGLDTQGVDINFSQRIDTSLGVFTLAANAAYIFEIDQRITDTAPTFDSAGTFNNPAQLRARLSANFERGPWQSIVFANYTSGYDDNRATTVQHVSSFSTLDGRIAYSMGSERAPFKIALNIQNVFDRSPPNTTILSESDLGFDPANANPVGRLVSVELVKSW